MQLALNMRNRVNPVLFQCAYRPYGSKPGGPVLVRIPRNSCIGRIHLDVEGSDASQLDHDLRLQERMDEALLALGAVVQL